MALLTDSSLEDKLSMAPTPPINPFSNQRILASLEDLYLEYIWVTGK